MPTPASSRFWVCALSILLVWSRTSRARAVSRSSAYVFCSVCNAALDAGKSIATLGLVLQSHMLSLPEGGASGVVMVGVSATSASKRPRLPAASPLLSRVQRMLGAPTQAYNATSVAPAIV